MLRTGRHSDRWHMQSAVCGRKWDWSWRDVDGGSTVEYWTKCRWHILQRRFDWSIPRSQCSYRHWTNSDRWSTSKFKWKPLRGKSSRERPRISMLPLPRSLYYGQGDIKWVYRQNPNLNRIVWQFSGLHVLSLSHRWNRLWCGWSHSRMHVCRLW